MHEPLYCTLTHMVSFAYRERSLESRFSLLVTFCFSAPIFWILPTHAGRPLSRYTIRSIQYHQLHGLSRGDWKPPSCSLWRHYGRYPQWAGSTGRNLGNLLCGCISAQETPTALLFHSVLISRLALGRHVFFIFSHFLMRGLQRRRNSGYHDRSGVSMRGHGNGTDMIMPLPPPS